jgi:hypothetical protein
MAWRDLMRRREPSPPWVPVAVAMHEPEADMLINVLQNAGIPAMQRRSGFDNPGMLAGGPRQILVRAQDQLEAHAILDPLPDDPETE